MAQRPTTYANPNVPHINQPTLDVQSIASVVTQLRQGVESLGGHRGQSFDRAATLQDLIDLGLVTADQVTAALMNTPSARR
jgi:hypothetical protein